jgi:hypothetical protein
VSPAKISVGLINNTKYQKYFGPFTLTLFDISKKMIVQVADDFYQTTAGNIIK